MANRTRHYSILIEEDTTVNDLLNSSDLYSAYRDDPSSFLNLIATKYTNKGVEVKYRNLDQIYNAYNKSEQKQYLSDYNSTNLSYIKTGTLIWIKYEDAVQSIVPLVGEDLFLETNDFEGFWNENFRLIHNDSLNFPDIKNSDEDYGNENLLSLRHYNTSVIITDVAIQNPKIYEVNKLVESIDISVGIGSGGNFNIVLNDVSIDLGSNNNDYQELMATSRLENSKINKLTKLMTRIGQKSIVFIRFEHLGYEPSVGKLKDNESFLESLKPSDVPSNDDMIRSYDMIGFVDNVSEDFDPVSNNHTVSISGRDVNGLLEDDASYFYPLAFADTGEMTISNTEESTVFQRNVIYGQFDEYFTNKMRSIKESIGFVVTQLSVLEIGGSNVFAGYGFVNDDLVDISNNLTNGKKRSRFFSVGDYQLNTNRGDSVDLDNVDYYPAKGIWQIVDIAIDPNLEDRRCVNSQLVKSEGSLKSHMDSICQPPLVEFYGDTYVDKFVFTARQPPYSKNAVRSWLQNNYTISIYDNDIIDINLQWETNYYSWYEIQYNDNFLGYDKSTVVGYIPIVYLNEFARDFGNNRFLLSDSYVSKNSVTPKNQSLKYDPQKEALKKDLFWCVECFTHLPFTRRGTITIMGDRRIKVGTFIYLDRTSEVFYVESVSNNFRVGDTDIDRTTTITVTRGMVLKNIFEPVYNYWNIVNLEGVKNQYKDDYKESKKTPKSKVTIGDTKYAFDKYNLTDAAKSQIDTEIVAYLNENPDINASVEGHTDWFGSYEYNQDLSENRAKSVYFYLLEQGIDKGRLSWVGHSEGSPIDTNETDAGRANNRRTEVIFKQGQTQTENDPVTKQGNADAEKQPTVNNNVYRYFKQRHQFYYDEEDYFGQSIGESYPELEFGVADENGVAKSSALFGVDENLNSQGNGLGKLIVDL